MADSKSAVSTLTERSYLPEFIYLLKEKRKIVFILAFMVGIGTLINHILYIPVFIASAHLEVVNTRDNLLSKVSSGDSPAAGMFGIDSSQELQRHLFRLRSGSYYEKVAEGLVSAPEYSKLNLTRSNELSIFHMKFWRTRFSKLLGEKPENIGNPAPKSREEIMYLAGLLQDVTSVGNDGSEWISLSVRTFDPNTSLFLVTLEANTYLHLTLDQARNDLNELQDFIKERLSDAEAKLSKEESELVQVKRKNGILNVEEAGRTYAGRIREIQDKLGSIQLKVEENEQLIEFFEQRLSEHLETVLNAKSESGQHNDPGSLSSQLESLKHQKSLYLAKGLSNANDEVAALNNQIRKIAESIQRKALEGGDSQPEVANLNAAALQAKITQLENENALAQTQIAAMEKARDSVLNSVTTFPRVEQELMGRTESLKIEYELFSSLKKKLQDLDIQKLAIRNPIKIDPLFSLAPREVRVSLLLRLPFTILVGAFLGCLVILLLEFLNTSVRHFSDLESINLTVLGDIPLIKSKLSESGDRSMWNPELLVCESRPGSTEAMAFNYVRERIRAVITQEASSIRSFAISGTDKYAGKTFFSINLAISLARAGKRVVLVDGDLHFPSIHSYLGLKNKKGLTTLLEENEATLKSCLAESKIKNLDVLLAGPKTIRPTELLGSEKFRAFIEAAKKEYDYVIVDTPSSVHLPDAPVVASVTDAAILVAGYRTTKKSMLLVAHRKIFQISHRYAYGVLNRVPSEIRDFSYNVFGGENST